MKKIALAALLSVCVASPALAADPVYVGLKVGRTNTSLAGLTSNKDTGAGIFAGVKFNQNFGFELAYTDLGKVNTLASSARLSEWDASLIGTLPLNATFSLNGRLGIAHSKYDQAGGGIGKRNAATYGINAQAEINPTFAVRAGWDRYGITQPLGPKGDTNLYSLSAMIKF